MQKHWREILAGQDYGVWKPADRHSGRVQRELHALAGMAYSEPEPKTAGERMWCAVPPSTRPDLTEAWS